MGNEFCPDMVGGHSLGEFSALVAAGVLDFEDGLKLVYARALAMQKACEAAPGGMAAVMRLDNEKIEQICSDVTAQAGKGVVVAANYNCPGQLVISGNKEAVEAACEKLLEAGARRALMLPVGGAFHSPLMQSAKNELEATIAATEFHEPTCPVYQNVDGKAHTNPEEIKQNLIAQLTASVRWTQEVEAMVEAGATEFVECGPGQALTGMITKIAKDAVVMHA
jgi:[acyl-carrier-protein] S-malonyltransferase